MGLNSNKFRKSGNTKIHSKKGKFYDNVGQGAEEKYTYRSRNERFFIFFLCSFHFLGVAYKPLFLIKMTKPSALQFNLCSAFSNIGKVDFLGEGVLHLGAHTMQYDVSTRFFTNQLDVSCFSISDHAMLTWGFVVRFVHVKRITTMARPQALCLHINPYFVWQLCMGAGDGFYCMDSCHTTVGKYQMPSFQTSTLNCNRYPECFRVLLKLGRLYGFATGKWFHSILLFRKPLQVVKRFVLKKCTVLISWGLFINWICFVSQ